jgi:hypothetical protein
VRRADFDRARALLEETASHDYALTADHRAENARYSESVALRWERHGSELRREWAERVGRLALIAAEAGAYISGVCLEDQAWVHLMATCDRDAERPEAAHAAAEHV